ncbi:hypothetical protein [Cyanobacterium stanieri]|uniref:hypothetical protein n=1 Tax=Cyanobacterium stanieri TaxID=102235 RepID=UPI0019D4F4D9|nr:hypothetical protein [Cyanobacterium stanieri]
MNKINLEIGYGNYLFCSTESWSDLVNKCPTYPHILEEYRQVNRAFYQKVVNLLNSVH